MNLFQNNKVNERISDLLKIQRKRKLAGIIDFYFFNLKNYIQFGKKQKQNAMKRK